MMKGDRQRGPHDVGGVARFQSEALDKAPHGLSQFDKEVDAIRAILGAKRVMSVDELRRGIEALPEADYLRLAYYERWLVSMVGTLLLRGIISEADLAAHLGGSA